MRVLSVLGSICLLVLAGSASANVINWGGGTDGKWTVNTNWSGNALPGALDTAVIASGAAQIDADLVTTPAVVRIDTGGTADLNTAGTLNTPLTLNGGTLSMPGTWAGNNQTLNGAITLTAPSTISRTYTNTNRGFTLAGAITEQGGSQSLTFAGNTVTTFNQFAPTTEIKLASSYSGGTTITGSRVQVDLAGGLGSGPVAVNGGQLLLNAAGQYTNGAVTVNSGGQVMFGASPTNMTINLTGGTMFDNNVSMTLSSSNTITSSGTFNVGSLGYNSTLNVAAGITGSGKAVLMNGISNGNRVQFSGVEQWTGGTEVDGAVEMITGGQLPAGTVTVNAPFVPTYGTGLLRLLDTTAGQNGGLNTATNLVLNYSNGFYGTIYIGSGISNVTVNSLTLNGVMQPAGVYSMANLPNYIVGSSTRTLTVLTPEPTTLALLALSGLLLARRRHA